MTTLQVKLTEPLAQHLKKRTDYSGLSNAAYMKMLILKDMENFFPEDIMSPEEEQAYQKAKEAYKKGDYYSEEEMDSLLAHV